VQVVAVRAVQLDAIIASFLEVFGSVGPALDEGCNVVIRGSMRFGETHANDFALELNIGRRDRVGLDAILDLSAWVADLADEEAAACLAGCCHCAVPLEALAVERVIAGDDGVSCSLQMIIFNHDVAGQDQANAALAPSLVEVNEILRGHAARG